MSFLEGQRTYVLLCPSNNKRPLTIVLSAYPHYYRQGIKEMSAEKDAFSRLKPSWKLWLEYDGEYVFGPGAYAILKNIREKGTITEGAKALGMSYRYAWGVVRKIEQALGVKLIDTFKGGTEGGGGARITDFGLKLMDLFASVQESFEQVSREEDHHRS